MREHQHLRISPFIFYEEIMLYGITRSNQDCAGMIGAGDKDADLVAIAIVCGTREFHSAECAGWVFCAGVR
jgi:hypothetical protein